MAGQQTLSGRDPKLLYRADDMLPDPGSAAAAEVADVCGKAMAALAATRVQRDSAPLQPRFASTPVRVRNGETLVTDGPAAEIGDEDCSAA